MHLLMVPINMQALYYGISGLGNFDDIVCSLQGILTVLSTV